MSIEKTVFKGLKWLFSFFIGVMGVATIGLLLIIGLIQLPSVKEAIKVTVDPFGSNTLAIVSSPILIGLIVINFILFGLLFYYIRSFFRNLEIEEIFVKNNVIMAKRISAILVVLSVISCLPDLYTTLSGLTSEGYSLDFGYIVGAAIVWALAKILEKANIIAEENEMTI